MEHIQIFIGSSIWSVRTNLCICHLCVVERELVWFSNWSVFEPIPLKEERMRDICHFFMSHRTQFIYIL